MQKAYKLHGISRHYDWGGSSFIPQLLKIENPTNQPFAEYWMGAHPSAPSTIDTIDLPKQLDVCIQSDPVYFLGENTTSVYGQLPYLFKILDVQKMLSIQVHPTKEAAEIGFALEEKIGIDMQAPHRNYKDKNHKPEVMVALSDFWLLHGFQPAEMITATLQTYESFHCLLPHFDNGNYKALYQYVMQLSAEESDLILKPVLIAAISQVASGAVDKMHPHWWANKYYQGILPEKNIDKGIFSIYVLNILRLHKNEGIFQGAGLLHAYLEGQNIELMANSDNVLRGGLTPKHVDCAELLKNVQFLPTYPSILKGETINAKETLYPCPVNDFGLSKIGLNAGETYTIVTKSIEMFLVMEGVILANSKLYTVGEVMMVTALQEIEIYAQETTLLFKSFVP